MRRSSTARRHRHQDADNLEVGLVDDLYALLNRPNRSPTGSGAAESSAGSRLRDGAGYQRIRAAVAADPEAGLRAAISPMTVASTPDIVGTVWLRC